MSILNYLTSHWNNLFTLWRMSSASQSLQWTFLQKRFVIDESSSCVDCRELTIDEGKNPECLLCFRATQKKRNKIGFNKIRTQSIHTRDFVVSLKRSSWNNEGGRPWTFIKQKGDVPFLISFLLSLLTLNSLFFIPTNLSLILILFLLHQLLH